MVSLPFGWSRDGGEVSAANLVPPLVVSPGVHPAAPQLTTSGYAGRPPRVRTMRLNIMARV